MEDLFDKFDDNNNNILDSTEVAKLNFEFLTTIPRIGIQKLGKVYCVLTTIPRIGIQKLGKVYCVLT